MSELADFEPSTGHRHDCMNTDDPGSDADCRCAGELYVIAQEAEERLAPGGHWRPPGHAIEEAIAATRVTPETWEALSDSARAAIMRSAAAPARLVRLALRRALPSQADAVAAINAEHATRPEECADAVLTLVRARLGL